MIVTAYQLRNTPTSASCDLRRLRESTSRQHLLRTHAALWCPTCQATLPIVDSFGTVAQLSCKHRREITPGLHGQIEKLEREVEQQKGVPEC
jgi:hypothetical protein